MTMKANPKHGVVRNSRKNVQLLRTLMKEPSLSVHRISERLDLAPKYILNLQSDLAWDIIQAHARRIGHEKDNAD